jgi:hypothetical protein
VLAACAIDSTPRSTPDAEQPATVAQGLTTFQFDTTAIAVAPSPTLPVRPLTLGAFGLPNVQRALLGVPETFAQTNAAGARTFYDSGTWHAEIDATGGQILAVSQAPSLPAVPQSERVLEANARQRLASFGVPPDELGPLAQRRSMSLDEQGGATAAAAEIEGYKTFAFRGLNGVRVRGHRAVLTYGADGAFRRALVKWPALAASGHKLRTPLATADITTRATRALTAEGIPGGPITLRWLYVPTALPSGEVTLELEVMAIVPGTTVLGEGRAVDVGVDAS